MATQHLVTEANVLRVRKLRGIERAGFDIEKIWLGNILGVLTGVVLLYYFGNNAVSLAAFAAFALVPELLTRRKSPAQLSKWLGAMPRA